jgi:hypothetical protein
MSELPLLRLVNEETGEITQQACPHCQEHLDTLTALEHKHRAALAEITRMKRDPEAEARKHKAWDEACALFDWWRLATWHPGVAFEADEFYAVLPRLKEGRTPIDILRGIAGLAFDPNRKTTKSGHLEIYDSWDLLNKSKTNLSRYEARAPGAPIKEGVVSPEHDTKWRIWLVQRIQSNFKEEK